MNELDALETPAVISGHLQNCNRIVDAAKSIALQCFSSHTVAEAAILNWQSGYVIGRSAKQYRYSVFIL
jgi:hypothetical protein